MPYVSRRDLRLTATEVEAFLSSNRWGRLATANLEAEPHVTPLGYVYHGAAIWFHGLRTSRRGHDLRVNSSVAFLVDDGIEEDYSKRRGVIAYGRCTVADEDPAMPEARLAYMRAFGATSVAQVQRRTHAWYRIDIQRTASWDFRKIPEGADRSA
jgi:nitroimidazol reductase NimA-like FMN-containing flavoprotein (pyridoxamine 5'-phosphate oxidase superfamily)